MLYDGCLFKQTEPDGRVGEKNGWTDGRRSITQNARPGNGCGLCMLYIRMFVRPNRDKGVTIITYIGHKFK